MDVVQAHAGAIRRLANSPTLATGSASPASTVFGCGIPPPRPPAQPPKLARSACEEHREWIESQVALRRNAQSIYQDLVDRLGFAHRYNSVKRFVRTLRKRDPRTLHMRLRNHYPECGSEDHLVGTTSSWSTAPRG